MKEYKIYRGEDGELTFATYGEHEYTVKSNTDGAAQEAIRMLKRAEKQIKKEQDNEPF